MIHLGASFYPEQGEIMREERTKKSTFNIECVELMKGERHTYNKQCTRNFSSSYRCICAISYKNEKKRV